MTLPVMDNVSFQQGARTVSDLTPVVLHKRWGRLGLTFLRGQGEEQPVSTCVRLIWPEEPSASSTQLKSPCCDFNRLSLTLIPVALESNAFLHHCPQSQPPLTYLGATAPSVIHA